MAFDKEKSPPQATVLVMTDDNEDADSLARFLVRHDMTVLRAYNGLECLEIVRTHTVDVVFLDVKMPGMDGPALLAVGAELRQISPALPIILVNEDDWDTRRARAMAAAGVTTWYETLVAHPPPLKLSDHAGILARIRAGERSVRYQKMLKEQQALLEQLAREDKLTGLCNRRHFEERAQEECSRAQRYDRPLSLLLGDLDHFKQVNDRYGHAYGDMVHRQVGQTLQLHCRSSDLVARYGGEEFTVLLVETEPEHAERVAEQLCTAVRELSFPHPSGPFHVTISFGVASLSDQHPQDLAALFEEADKALYTAKQKGRDRVERWTGGSPTASALL